jgi:hypothetical protein
MLGTRRHVWEHIININIRRIGFVDVDWINLAQNRVQRRTILNTVMNIRVY